MSELQDYIELHLHIVPLYGHQEELILEEDLTLNEIESYIRDHLKPPFTSVLFQMIEQTGETDSEVYKRAGLDRRHFSKIRSNEHYRPKK